MEERLRFGAQLFVLVAAVVTVLAVGEPTWAIPIAILGCLLLVGIAISFALQRRAAAVDAVGDHQASSLPLTASRPAGGALGDDEEHHDEITAHDIPKSTRDVPQPSARRASTRRASPAGTSSGEPGPARRRLRRGGRGS